MICQTLENIDHGNFVLSPNVCGGGGGGGGCQQHENDRLRNILRRETIQGGMYGSKVRSLWNTSIN